MGIQLKVDHLCEDSKLGSWTDPVAWAAIFDKVAEECWQGFMLFPPCGTFSRARHHNSASRNGPRPLRGRNFPHGFPWLAKQSLEAVRREDFIIFQCLKLIQQASEAGLGWSLVHPEDLGKLRSLEDPASIWQWSELRSVLEATSCAATWAVHLCAYGADAAHPTRVATNVPQGPYELQWPVFDESGYYAGPLTRCQHAHENKVGRRGSDWATSSALTSGFAEELANMMLCSTCDHRSTDGSFQGAEAFADFLLKQEQISLHDAEALFKLLPLEAAHPAVQMPSDAGDQAFFGGAFRKGPFKGLRKSCTVFPKSLQCFTRLLRTYFPGDIFCSIGVFLNVQAEMHKDSRNGPYPNLLLALSNFTNGQVWTEDDAGTIFREVRGVFKPGRLLPVAESPQRLMAHQCYHQTEPWTGERLLLVGFTISDPLHLESTHLDTLRDLGFVLPASSHLKGGEAIDEDGQEPPLSTPRDAAASGAPLNTPRDASASGAPEDLSTPSGGPTRVAHISTPAEGPTPSASTNDLLVLEQTSQEGEEEANEAVDFDPNTSRCRGPPIKCRHTREWRELVDGFGLCSPGRWRPLARNALASTGEWDHASSIRKVLAEAVHQAIPDLRKAAFALATGRLIKSPFSEKLINDVRARIATTLPDPEQALCKPDGQPFMLHMLSQSLKILGDPDYEILDQGSESFAEGVPLGWDKPIGRTPQVFPKRIHFRKLDESDFDPSMVNYRSAELNAAQLEEKFRQDEQAGMMLCTTEPEARRKYGSEAVLIAAMGAVTKANGDVRPLHDGTHGINLNNSIVILDKLQVPGPEDLQEVASRVKESKEAPFSLCADISHARRNVKVRESDWPRLACKSSSASRVLWLNKVGTFGVSSAAYYWTRLFGAVGRWAFRVLHLDKFYMLVYVDDLHVVVYGSDKFETLWILFLALEIMGTPFSFHKFKGGVNVDYIGYHLCYYTWSAGISEKRASWIIEWINLAEQAQWMITGRQLTEFIGRLNFVTRLLAWLKPFLAPLFAWSAALNRSTAATTPEMVIHVLRFYRWQFMNGARLDTVHMSWPSCDRQAFRTDAKCESGRIVLGGWSLEHGLNTRQAPWFALEISPDELPALFKDGHSSEWASTTAELLASYAGLVAFRHLVPTGGRDSLRLQVHAGTDNSATPAVLAKGISNKWPVQGLHMQMAVSLRKANKVCRLTWRPREENQDADDLTNLRFENFAPSLRVPLELADVPLELFHMLHKSHADFVAERDRLLSLKRDEPKTTKRQKLLDKTPW